MLESFGGQYSITELNKAAQHYTNDPNAKYSDLTGEANRALRDKIRSNIKYHKGVFVIPGTEFFVQNKTAKLNKFLKDKKTIKQSELIKKLEELGYKNSKLFVNNVAFNRPELNIVRDVDRQPMSLKGSKLYTTAQLNKASKGMFEGTLYDDLGSTERGQVEGKLRTQGGKYSKFRKINNPLSTQEIKDIKTKYGNVFKNWDFNNNRFGLGPTGNQKLYDKIRNFVAEAKPYELTADLSSADGWMGAQMNRAYKLEDTRYKPIRVIRNGKERIAGFIDNTKFGKGKKYIFSEEFIKGSNADGVLMSTHPDFEETKKFRDIAKKGKVPVQGALKNILRNKGVDTTRITLSDLYKYMLGEVGVEGTKNAVEQHHIKGVGVRATGDYQLLGRDLNTLARDVAAEIKGGNLNRVAELEKAGVKIEVGGQIYGAASGKPSQDFLKIKSQLTDFYKTPKGENVLQKIGDLVSKLKGDGRKRVCGIGTKVLEGLAAGGRVGYKAAGVVGSCPIIPALEAAPEQTMNELSKLGNQTGVLGRIGNTAKGFLGFLGKFKVGKYGAIAAVGALAQPLVKQFMNDDPFTYLTDPDQQAGMLEALIEGERPKPRSEILDTAVTGTHVAGTAAAVPGTGALWKARRQPFTDKLGKTRAGMGMPRAALGPVGKFIAGAYTPAGLLAMEPLRIAQMRREGESWGEVAKSPTLWMGPAFADTMTKMATAGMKGSPRLAKALSLGMSRPMLKTISRRFGMPGLALSLGLSGYDTYKDYKKKRGFFARDEE